MPQAEIDLDVAAASSILALVDDRLRAVAITRMTGGIVNSVVDVRASDGRSLIVKLYPVQLRSRMQKEVFVHERLRGHALAGRTGS